MVGVAYALGLQGDCTASVLIGYIQFKPSYSGVEFWGWRVQSPKLIINKRGTEPTLYVQQVELRLKEPPCSFSEFNAILKHSSARLID